MYYPILSMYYPILSNYEMSTVHGSIHVAHLIGIQDKKMNLMHITNE